MNKTFKQTIEIVKWQEGLKHSEWLKYRKSVIQGVGQEYTRVSASDIGTITGSNSFKSKRRLMLELSGLYSKRQVSPILTQGSLQEDIVGKYYESYTLGDEEQTYMDTQDGIKHRLIQKADFFVLNSKYPHLSASLDFIHVGDTYSPFTGELYAPMTPIETKYINPQAYMQWDSWITQYYLEQTTLQGTMVELDTVVFAVLRWDGKFSVNEVRVDKDLAEYLVETSGEFALDATKIKLLKLKSELTTDALEKHDLENQIEELLPHDGLDDSVDLANERHIGSIDELRLQVEDDSDTNQLMRDYVSYQEQEKEIKYKQNETKSKLITLADGFEGIESSEFKATIRGNNSRKGTYFRINAKRK